MVFFSALIGDFHFFPVSDFVDLGPLTATTRNFIIKIVVLLLLFAVPIRNNTQ